MVNGAQEKAIINIQHSNKHQRQLRIKIWRCGNNSGINNKIRNCTI